jgi:hypothetical protein
MHPIRDSTEDAESNQGLMGVLNDQLWQSAFWDALSPPWERHVDPAEIKKPEFLSPLESRDILLPTAVRRQLGPGFEKSQAGQLAHDSMEQAVPDAGFPP